MGAVGEQLLKEWDYDNNTPFSPAEITYGSNASVYWKCSKGHTWLAPISNRIVGHGCPVCTNKTVIAGINDLATTHPDLLLDWDYDENSLLPTQITYGSELKVIWRCHTCENRWTSSPNNRTSGLHGCPFCSHHTVNHSHTSLLACNPDIALEWNY